MSPNQTSSNLTPGRVPSTMNTTFINEYSMAAYSSPQTSNGGPSLIDHVKQELKSILPSIKINHEPYSPQKVRHNVLSDARFKKRLI